MNQNLRWELRSTTGWDRPWGNTPNRSSTGRERWEPWRRPGAASGSLGIEERKGKFIVSWKWINSKTVIHCEETQDTDPGEKNIKLPNHYICIGSRWVKGECPIVFAAFYKPPQCSVGVKMKGMARGWCWTNKERVWVCIFVSCS